MTDIMLQGVLRMSYEMAMENEWSRRQFHDRAKQAADRIEELESVVRELIDANEDRAKKAVHHGNAWIDALGRMKAAWDKARAALGE